MQNTQFEPNQTDIGSAELVQRVSELERIVEEKTLELERRNQEVKGIFDALNMIQGELLQAQKLESIGRLASGVAHEINTPVQFIGDSVHFLDSGLTDLLGLVAALLNSAHLVSSGQANFQDFGAEIEEITKKFDYKYLVKNLPQSVERAIEGLQRVDVIVRSMKAFAFPDQKVVSAMDINGGLTATVGIARNEYKYVAEVELDLGDIPMVDGYLGEMNQVFLNLIVNAAHAIGDVYKRTDEKGLISIRTRRDGDDVVIEISDSGSGIPAYVQSYIFDPFFTTKELGKGTGQGLAISRQVVTQKHNGEIWFTTKQDTGTTFFIRLPIRHVPKEGAPDQSGLAA